MNVELAALYAAERERLATLAGLDNGDYLSPVFGEGEPGAELMLIGEAPGREEAAAGHPFVGKAGKQLDELLELAELDRSRLFVTNTVKFRPIRHGVRSVANRTPTAAELGSGKELLGREIGIVRPKIIATLGNSPLASICELCGLAKLKIGVQHGQTISAAAAGHSFILFPLYHPASGIYNRELIAVMRQDIILLGQCIREGLA